MRCSALWLALLPLLTACGDGPTEANQAVTVHISGRVTHDGVPRRGRAYLREEYCRTWDGWACPDHVSRSLIGSRVEIQDGYFELTHTVWPCRASSLKLAIEIVGPDLCPGPYFRSVKCTSESQVVNWERLSPSSHCGG